MPTLLRRYARALLAVLTLAVTLLWTAPSATSAAAAEAPAARALNALLHDSADHAAAAVPTDFADRFGYTPTVEDGLLGDANGGCSSPVPLPAQFTPACKAHDYGYDLLRYAAADGTPLPASAREQVDGTLHARMRSACSAGPPSGRLGCLSWAEIANAAVRGNSLRQHDLAPGPEDARSVATATGTVLLAVAAAGLLIAAVRRRARAGWVRLHAGWRRLAGPPWKRSTWTALPAAVLIAGFPSFLPLPPMVFGAVVMLVLSPLSALARTATRPFAALPQPSLRATATASIAVTGGLMLWLTIAQNGLRVHGGLPPLGPIEVLAAAAAAAAVALLRRGIRSLWACRGRWWRPATAGALSLALISGTTTSAQARAQDAASETNVLSSASTTGAARVFVPLSAGATPAERAARAVQDLRHAGGFDREHLVIVAPTGSGWVDPNLVSGLEDRFGAQVSTLAVQYDDRPSWLAYLTARQQASESTLAVLRAVLRQVRELPADRRPQVHLAGESLGATAGQGALRQLTETERSQVCSALWVGTPGGRRTHLVTESMVANADDPVVHGSPAMLVSPAKAPTAPWLPWLPMVSAAHVFADFTLSLAGPVGTGHRYGPDQVDGLAVCD